jgi:hypothetical protein
MWNEQSRTAEKVWSSSWGLGEVLPTSHRKNLRMFRNISQGFGFMVPCIIYQSMKKTNLMPQTWVFISPQSSTLHVSGATSTHHQELQTCTLRYGITWSRYKPVDVESSANRVLCVCSPCTDVQGLQTHNTLLADDSTTTGLYHDQVIPYLIVHVWSSWWWVGVTPETCREKN